MSIDKAITYLKKKAPKGEFLAYINSKEAAMLKKAGGSGELVNGIPSYRSKAGMDSKARSSSYSSPSSSPSPRGPQELGTSTRTVNRIASKPPQQFIGGKSYDVTPETRGDRDRAQLKQQILNQTTLGGNRIDKYGNTRKSPFTRGGGLGSLIMSGLGMLMGIPGIGLLTGGLRNLGSGLGSGLDSLNRKMRGVNPDGTTRTQAEYEQARYDRQQQNRLDKLFAAKDRGYNQIGFGDFTAKTVDFTPGQQAIIDELLAAGYEPSTARNILTGRDLNLRGTLNQPATGIETIQQLAQPNINAFPGMGVAPQPLPGRFIEPLSPNLDDPVQNQVGNIDYLMAAANAPGNNFLYNTGNPYKDNLYDSEGNYDPYGIKGEPEPETEVREIAIG